MALAVLNYTYDGDGNRLEKVNQKFFWYGAGTEILDESDTSGNFSNEYVFFGGKRVAMRNVSSGTTYYYAEDMLGSSRTIVQAGQTTPCYDADFYPFGGERIVTNSCTQTQNYKFEGKERDTETGNDDFGARYYSSRMGRWLSADWSSVPVPVPYANLSNPQTLNLYAMVRDNPETFADLDGHTCGFNGETYTCTSDPSANPGTTNEVKGKDAIDGSKSTTQQAEDADAKKQAADQQNKTQQENVDSQKVGSTTVGGLEKTMSNEDRSLSGGAPGQLEQGKTALANAIINNAELPHPAKVAQATGTATSQDAQIMRNAVTSRANGGADPVHGRTQYGTTHNPRIKSRSASNHLKGPAGRETVYEKFGPFRDSVSRRPTWIVIYNDPGH